MSLPTESSLLQRRTSERRRLKLLKNSDEYKISNPFKFSRQEPCIPDDLFKQLKKIDYLSRSSISMLQVDKNINNENYCSDILQKMSTALRSQEDRYRTYFGAFCNFHNPEEELDLESSFPNKKYQTEKSSMLHTKQQIAMDEGEGEQPYKQEMEEERFLQMQMCDEDEVGINLFESESSPLEQVEHTAGHQREDEQIPIDEQYQNYFIN